MILRINIFVLVLALICCHATAALFNLNSESISELFKEINIDSSSIHASFAETVERTSKSIQNVQHIMRQNLGDVLQPENLGAVMGDMKEFSKSKFSIAQKLLEEHPEVRFWLRDEALPALDRFIITTQEQTKAAEQELLQFDWKSVPPVIKEYVLAHPGEVAFYTASGVLYVAPGLLYGPTLGALGWTRFGPAAASYAATLQSYYNPVSARGLFATFQSAQMGGFGTAALAQAARVAIGAIVTGKVSFGVIELLKSKNDATEAVAFGDFGADLVVHRDAAEMSETLGPWICDRQQEMNRKFYPTMTLDTRTLGYY